MAQLDKADLAPGKALVEKQHHRLAVVDVVFADNTLPFELGFQFWKIRQLFDDHRPVFQKVLEGVDKYGDDLRRVSGLQPPQPRFE